MSTPYRECAETVRQLYAAVVELARCGKLLQLPALNGREWFELLRQKLLPQLDDDAFLVVAVVGGTNIGKSVIFNHIAGSRASSTSPLASGTRHPVCLVPPGFEERHDLASIFEGFQLKRWSSSDAALEKKVEHQLFWKVSPATAANLLVLDTPDIDSDAEVNWQRADHIRRCADVLIAVLTQQKYNDAAVKRFFRKAAAEDKAVIVVFNQCELPEDEDYWPLWLETFCRETDIQPEFVYISPSDRRAAEENRLPFYGRCWPIDKRKPTIEKADQKCAAVRSLADDLSGLRFAEIKFRTLRGSLSHLLDPQAGVPGYLDEVRERSAGFLAAAKRLSSESIVKIGDWPTVPNKLFVEQVRQWWKREHEGWARHVHSFYDTVGQGVSWPFRFAREKLGGKQTPPLDIYRKQEWTVVLKTIEEIFEKLTWMTESGSELLKPYFERLLAGQSRQKLLEQLKDQHEQVELQTVLAEIVESQMLEFQKGSPELYKFYRQLNNVSAAVRPVTSVVLFTMGWGPAGELVAPIVADAATQAVMPIVADFAGGAAAAVAGETVVSSAAGKGAGLLQAKFQKLQTAFTARRAGWLARSLKEQLLGSLPEQLQSAAAVGQSEAFERVATILKTLEKQLETDQLTNDE